MNRRPMWAIILARTSHRKAALRIYRRSMKEKDHA